MVHGPPGLPVGPFGECALRRRSSHLVQLPAARNPEASTQKARPMFAPSTVPIAPHPARIKEGQHCGSLLPRSGCKCNSKFSWQLPSCSGPRQPSG